MKIWVTFGLMLLYASWGRAAVLEDPIQVSVGSENDHLVLAAHFFAPVSRELAWDVMVDFDHMIDFLPYLKESKVLSRQGNLLRVQQKGVVPVSLLDVGYISIRDVELFPYSEIHATTVGGDSGLTRSVARLLPGEWQTEVDYRADWWPASQMLASFSLGHARNLLFRQFTAMRLEMLKRNSR